MSADSIPVETILRLALDTSSASEIKDWLDGHERQWSAVERVVGKIGDHLEGITRMGLGLAGMAGVGGLLTSFVNTSQYGGMAALAAGRVTGGMGAWHPYQQAMLSAQAQTGVQASEITVGLVQALQAAGGTPTAYQAAMIGGVLAGYGQVSGMTPAQVAQVITPLLQAANRPLTAGNILSLGGVLTGGLSNFPGLQAAPVMAQIAQLGVAGALGAGPQHGYGANVAGLASLINTAAGANRIWRTQAGPAIGAIDSSLQGAYTNPRMEAFLQMAGIGYWQQRGGLAHSKNPAGMIARIMGEATSLAGTGATRDEMLRSMFGGVVPADLLEQFAPGTAAARTLAYDQAHPHSLSAQQLDHILHNAQLSTTGPSWLAKVEGAVQHWVFESPLHIGLAGGAAAATTIGGRRLLRAGARGIGSFLTGGLSRSERALVNRVRAGASTSAEDDAVMRMLENGKITLADLGGEAGGSTVGAIGGIAARGLLRGLGLAGGAMLPALVFPDSLGEGGHQQQQQAQLALRHLTAAAAHRFGSHFGNSASMGWMRQQILDAYRGATTGHGGSSVPGLGLAFGESTAPSALRHGMLGAVENFARQLSHSTAANPISTHDSGVAAQLGRLRQVLDHLGSGRTGASYSGGSVASFTAYGPTTAAASGTQFVSFPSLGPSALLDTAYTLPPGTSTPPGAAHSRAAAISAAAKRYGVPASLLWGIYGAESSYGTAYKPGQKTYGYFGLTGGEWTPSMNFQQDANAAAMTLAADIREKGGVNAGIESYSGGGYGLAHVLALARHHPADTRPIHVHVYVDGRKIQQSRVQRGKSSLI